MSTQDFISDDLEHLLGRRFTLEDIEDALHWLAQNPDGDLTEWGSEMITIGAL